MQFHLETLAQLKLLADVLLEQDPRQYGGILSKVMNRDLRFDCSELAETADLLAQKKHSLKDEIAGQASPELKMELQRQLELLEQVLDRVTEACFMS